MRDVTGFALLLAATVLLMWVLVGYVLPFLATYLFGLVAFLALASWLLRNGRVHPTHLDSYLKPRVGAAIALLALSAPSVHALLFWLVADMSDWWWLVAFANAGPAWIWSVHLLHAHRRQRALYHAEGHDIEDLLERATARDAALEVRSDALESLAAEHHEPEAWELAAGPGSAAPDVRPAVAASLADVAALRKAYVTPIRALDRCLAAVRAGAKPPAEDVREAALAIERTEADFKRHMAMSELLLSEASWGAARSWDD
ncbi:MAG: hypothetical protein FJ087_04570 [Deltaproteobacteria bacterium]|nr:hypothetical protein [Deltaproteobacteria bacterium]